MVDVHIINDPVWAANAKAQANILQQIGYVRIHYSEPILGDLFGARANAYKLGQMPFVSFIDADDQVLDPNFFKVAADFLMNNPQVSSVFSRCKIRKEGQSVGRDTPLIKWTPSVHDSWSIPLVHQIIVHRRENIARTFEQLSGVKWGYLESWIVNAAQMQFGSLHQLDSVAYEWLIKASSARHVPEMNPGKSVEALARKKLAEFKSAYVSRPPTIQI